MAARRLLYSFLVSWPAVLLSAVAIDSRFKEDPYVLPTAQNSRISAYAGPVRATAPLLLMEPGQLDLAAVEKTARYWVDGRREARLLPLYPSFKAETEDGVRAEIFAAKRRVSSMLVDAAKKHIEAGALQEAAADLLDSFEIGEISKFCDFRTVSASASIQRRSLTILSKLRPHLDDSSREQIAYRLREVLRDQGSISMLIAMSCRRFLERPNLVELSPEDRRMLASFPASVEAIRSPSQVRMTMAETLGKCNSNGGLLYFSEIRQGVDNQLGFIEQLQATLTAFEPESKTILARL